MCAALRPGFPIFIWWLSPARRYLCPAHKRRISYCFGYAISLCTFAYFLLAERSLTAPLVIIIIAPSSPCSLAWLLVLIFLLRPRIHKINHVSSPPLPTAIFINIFPAWAFHQNLLLRLFFAGIFVLVFSIPISWPSLRQEKRQTNSSRFIKHLSCFCFHFGRLTTRCPYKYATFILIELFMSLILAAFAGSLRAPKCATAKTC